MTEAFRQRLILHEGIRLKLYVDSVGKTSIGVGHNIEDRGLTYRQVVMILEDDVAIAEADLDKALPWAKDLDPVRREVFIELSFNLGISRLLGFKKALAAAQAGDWATCADQFMKSLWAKQVGQRAVTLTTLLRETTV